VCQYFVHKQIAIHFVDKKFPNFPLYRFKKIPIWPDSFSQRGWKKPCQGVVGLSSRNQKWELSVMCVSLCPSSRGSCYQATEVLSLCWTLHTPIDTWRGDQVLGSDPIQGWHQHRWGPNTNCHEQVVDLQLHKMPLLVQPLQEPHSLHSVMRLWNMGASRGHRTQDIGLWIQDSRRLHHISYIKHL